MAFKEASRLIGTDKRRRNIKFVIISYKNRISNATKYLRSYGDANLIYTIEIIIDCEFLIIYKRLIISSVFKLKGNTIKAISKLSFVNIEISGYTGDIRLLKTFKSIIGLADSNLLVGV